MAEAQQQTGKPQLRTRIQAYGINHLHVFFSSLGRIWRAPFASLMTASVIGIALALPAGFYTLLQNLQQLSGGWDGAARISLYLHNNVSLSQAEKFAKQLNTTPQIEKVRVIDKDAALEEFKALSGFGDALDALDSNPLPMVIVVTPVVDTENPQRVENLVEELANRPEVELVQLDLQWVKRLYTIMNLVQRGLIVIAGMLALAVILVIGNTIRLDIQNRHSEIQVNKLIGATNAFIRRPFLYTGFWYGLFGGLTACVLVVTALSLLQGPAKRLAGLYDSGFRVVNLGFGNSILLIAIAILLGYLGSWLAVGRHLRDIEPG
ncbi:MAG: cell division protein FtsX [Gammaproteobacteria bacterium]|nr:cell division protein FtsX [Gammaproteobacteria bacterium]